MQVDSEDRNETREASMALALLRHYDSHARSLPWRVPPGTPAPDPYRVWLSEIMLQGIGLFGDTKPALFLKIHQTDRRKTKQNFPHA